MEGNLSGQTLGPYRIIEQIGRGGMATVFKAYEPALDRYVAIKILPEYFAHYPEFVARFELEAKSIAKLNHPNIVPIFGYGQDKGFMYLVMRYVQAGTLRDLMGKPMPLPTVGEIFRQIAGALHYAHQQGIIHRDVKPTNVLMAEQKWPLLTDFGLAKMVENSAQLTKSGVGVGTPAYMSPEQGQGMKVDARSDIYSLGVMLYEMVTGHVPYDAETPMAIVLKHISAPLPLPRSVVPNLPEAVERVILKAMAKNPEDRYQSAEEMIRALDQALAEAPASALVTQVGAAAQVTSVSLDQPTQVAGVEGTTRLPSPAAKPAAATQAKPTRKGIPAWIWLLAGLLFIGLVGGGIGLALLLNPSTKTTPIAARPTQTQPPPKPTPVPTEIPPTLAPTAEPTPPFTACMVADVAGFKDKSFNQTAWQGLKAVEQNLGIETSFIEPKRPEDYGPSIHALLDNANCNILFTVGFPFGDALKAVAQEMPERKFAIVDFIYDPLLPNVRGSTYRTDQAAFLAGYLSAGMTKTGMIATYGGMHIPPVVAFMDGFTRGAQYYNDVKGTRVVVIGWDLARQEGEFTGNFSSREDGYRMAEKLTSMGADIIFPVAGIVGYGTLDYLKDQGKGLMIGVDSDFSRFYPEWSEMILASVTKNMDQFVLDTILITLKDNFLPNDYIGTLENGGVGLIPSSVWNQRIPDDLKIELRKITQEIIAGNIRTQP